MKIAFFNGQMGGSTGAIVKNLMGALKENGDSACLVSGHSVPPFDFPYYQTNRSLLIRGYSRFRAEIDGSDGFVDSFTTKKALAFLDQEKPDLIHLNITHDHYLQTELVLRYAHEKNIPVLWTNHDAWLATGRCCSFDSVGCQKWQEGCGHCPHRNLYRKAVLFDKSAFFFSKKRTLVSLVKPVLVAPSHWLGGILSKAGYPDVQILPNPIDLSFYKPGEKNQTILAWAKGRKVILATGNPLGETKGLKEVISLSQKLDPQRFLVVAGGVVDSISAPNLKLYPKITTPKEMAAFYNAGDVFINFTQEDNLPTVNIEALACGTPVVTHDVGGAKEMIKEGVGGYSFKKNTADEAIPFIEKALLLSERNAIAETVKDFSKETVCQRYLDLYRSLIALKR
jgi:putative colanic acid biosynthesis glycosyltransferase